MVRINIGVIILQENFVNVLFQKGLVLDDIIKLLKIEKINLCKSKNEFLNVIGCNKEEVVVMPLYVMTDANGKNYFI